MAAGWQAQASHWRRKLINSSSRVIIVMTGGSAALTEQLARELAPAEAYWLDLAPRQSAEVRRTSAISDEQLKQLSGSIAAWVHIVPTDGIRFDPNQPFAEASLVVRSWELAYEHLAKGIGASYIPVIPCEGSYLGARAMQIEIAGSTSVCLSRLSVSRWSREGRRINVVMNSSIGSFGSTGLRPEAVLKGRIPMDRLASVRDLAHAIGFLSSSGAAYVTGSTLPVDGGWTAYSWFYPYTET